jgi:hypothetical protein
MNNRFGLLIAAIAILSTQSHAEVVVTGVSTSHSHVKIYWKPVPGAKDFRVYDIANPNSVKYAGWTHLKAAEGCPGSTCFRHFVLQADGVTPVFPYQVTGAYPDGGQGGPQALNVPATQIDWNNVGDNVPHTLMVEAVDQLGPVPKASLYARGTSALVSPLPAGAMLGGNKGPTEDGKVSTNGQGPYINRPNVIDQSRRFIVQADPNLKAIPSKPTAAQTFFDTFDNSQATSLVQTYRNDTTTDAFGNLGTMKFSLNAGTPKEWNIEYRQANNRDSMPFISSDHYMDVLFDGATPGTNAPTSTIYGSMSMIPKKTIDISGGKILHLTMEVDGHQSINRRWLDFNLSPAADPIERWDPFGDAVNHANQAMFFEFRDGFCEMKVFDGPTDGSQPNETPGGSQLSCDGEAMWNPRSLSKNGFGFDDKSRYDLFISQAHVAIFQDGRMVSQANIPAGSFAWASQPLHAYFSHYIYHSDVELLETGFFELNGQNFCYPMNFYWFNDPVTGRPANVSVCNQAYPTGYGFSYSDERHWDNMGLEVLPASEAPGNDFSVFLPLVQLPPILPPEFVGSGAPSTCDLNQDTFVNVNDVQLCAIQAIGVATCGTGDVNQDSSCNVIDVQRVVNSALGGQCVTQ